jgi:hypothetical protein
MEVNDNHKKGGVLSPSRVQSVPRMTGVKKPFAQEIEEDKKEEPLSVDTSRFDFLNEKYAFTKQYPAQEEGETTELKQWSLTELEELDDWYKLHHPNQWQDWEDATTLRLKEKAEKKDAELARSFHTISPYAFQGHYTIDEENERAEEDKPIKEKKSIFQRKGVMILLVAVVGVLGIFLLHKGMRGKSPFNSKNRRRGW